MHTSLWLIKNNPPLLIGFVVSVNQTIDDGVQGLQTTLPFSVRTQKNNTRKNCTWH